MIGFRLRVGSHRLLASVAFAPGNHDRLPVTHHGAVNQAAGVDDIFRIGRIVVDDLHKTLELGAVITRADTLLPDHNHGHRLVGLRLTDDAHVAARSARIVLVHREDRAGCGIQLRIAVEIDRSGVETRTRSDVELRPFGNDVVRCGMAVHVERTAAAGFEPIHPGHTFLVGHRIVGHVEGPVDGNRAVLAVVKLGVGIEPEISTFDLAVVVELRLVGDFDFTRLQCGRRSVVELARGVDVEQSVDNERAFVDDGLAGKARLVGRKSTALEYIDGRIDRILLEVGFRLLDIYFTARKHRKGRLSDSNRRIERQFARHVENRSGMGRELAVQIDIARNLGARGNVIFRRRGIGFGDPAGSEVDIARRRLADNRAFGEVAFRLNRQCRIIGHRRAFAACSSGSADFRRFGAFHHGARNVESRGNRLHADRHGTVGQGSLHIKVPDPGGQRHGRRENRLRSLYLVHCAHSSRQR